MSESHDQIQIRQEILKASHLEHFKHAKDLALIYADINHPKRLKIENECNNILNKLHYGNKLDKI